MRAIVALRPERPSPDPTGPGSLSRAAPSRATLSRAARALARRTGRFARDEGGSVTVEAVLWLPFFFALLLLIVDVSFAFYGKAQAFRVVQNANRALSVRRPNMDTPAEVEAWVERAMEVWSPNADAVTLVDDGVVMTVLSIPATDLTLFSAMGSFTGISMTVRSAHFIE